MERRALLFTVLATWLPAMAQEGAPAVSIESEKLCTERPPSIFVFRSRASGMAPPLRFHWDLGDGRHWEEADVPEHAYDFGRYNVVLSVRDAAGQVKKASLALDVEAQGCGGI